MTISNTKSSTIWKIRGKDSWRQISSSTFIRSDCLWFKYYLKNDQELVPEIAIAVSRKYGNAVKRNRFKRRVKSSVRELIKNGVLPKNVVMLVGVSKANNKEVTFQEIASSLKNMAETQFGSEDDESR